MRPVDEIQVVNDRVVFWQGYEPEVKTDLSSHAFRTSQGWLLIDPIPLRHEVLEELGNIAGIFITSGNHERSSADFKKKTNACIFAHTAAREEITVPVDQWIEDVDSVFGLSAIHLPGFAPGECALYFAEGKGIMIMGDALINLESTGFAILPGKYCDDPALGRESLQKLLQFSFEAMTFAHGLPIIAGARQRLEELLS